ncbi:MAG: alpha/beta fold hydrolase [Patescibacteria group bacterium]|jgi:hypothetical protein
MNKVVYILHGLGADSHANWFPWLKQELKNKGYTVAVPDFPCSAMPKLDEWLQVLHSVMGQYGEGILIGHSLGGLLAVQYLLSGGKAPKVILAATPYAKFPLAPEIDGFFPTVQDLFEIKNLTEFVIFQSDNDPYLRPDDGAKWVQALGGKLTVLPGQGHLLSEEFPEICQFLEV